MHGSTTFPSKGSLKCIAFLACPESCRSTHSSRRSLVPCSYLKSIALQTLTAPPKHTKFQTGNTKQPCIWALRWAFTTVRHILRPESRVNSTYMFSLGLPHVVVFLLAVSAPSCVQGALHQRNPACGPRKKDARVTVALLGQGSRHYSKNIIALGSAWWKTCNDPSQWRLAPCSTTTPFSFFSCGLFPGFAGVEAQLLDLRTVTLQATQCPTDGSTACLLWRRSLLLELLLLLEIFHEVRPWWQRQVSRHSRHRGARSGALRRLRGTGLNFPLSEAGVAFSGLGGKQWFSRENLLKQSRES